jgi:hypothetical protein
MSSGNHFYFTVYDLETNDPVTALNTLIQDGDIDYFIGYQTGEPLSENYLVGYIHCTQATSQEQLTTDITGATNMDIIEETPTEWIEIMKTLSNITEGGVLPVP